MIPLFKARSIFYKTKLELSPSFTVQQLLETSFIGAFEKLYVKKNRRNSAPAPKIPKVFRGDSKGRGNFFPNFFFRGGAWT